MAKNQEFKYVFIIVFILIILCTVMNIKGGSGDSSQMDTTGTIKVNNKEYKMTPKKVVANPKIQYSPPPGPTIKNVDEPTGAVRFYNLLLSQFDFTDLEQMNNSYIILDPSDLLDRPPLFNMPEYMRKSILTIDDIKNVAVRVYELRSRNNNVGAYMSVGSLEGTREDVYLQHLEYDKDYSLKYKRTTLAGEEYLPIGDPKYKNSPTEAYEDFMRYRLSQMKRAGFDFVYFGEFDPISYFDIKDDNLVFKNPTINVNRYRQFLMRLFEYAIELKLKICISDFPSVFDGHEQRLSRYINYINVFSVDARSFPKPSQAFVKACSALPVFLSTIYNNNVIANFLSITGWPYYSILYEMTPIGNPFPVDLETIVIDKRGINWYPLPPRTWVNGIISDPRVPVELPKIVDPVLPIRNVYQPVSIPPKPKMSA